MNPSEALEAIRTLVEGSATLKEDVHRAVLLKGVIVIAQRGLGIAPDGEAEHAPNVLTFPAR
jgi:hypothetical protein